MAQPRAPRVTPAADDMAQLGRSATRQGDLGTPHLLTNARDSYGCDMTNPAPPPCEVCGRGLVTVRMVPPVDIHPERLAAERRTCVNLQCAAFGLRTRAVTA